MGRPPFQNVHRAAPSARTQRLIDAHRVNKPRTRSTTAVARPTLRPSPPKVGASRAGTSEMRRAKSPTPAAPLGNTEKNRFTKPLVADVLQVHDAALDRGSHCLCPIVDAELGQDS